MGELGLLEGTDVKAKETIISAAYQLLTFKATHGDRSLEMVEQTQQCCKLIDPPCSRFLVYSTFPAGSSQSLGTKSLIC